MISARIARPNCSPLPALPHSHREDVAQQRMPRHDGPFAGRMCRMYDRDPPETHIPSDATRSACERRSPLSGRAPSRDPEPDQRQIRVHRFDLAAQGRHETGDSAGRHNHRSIFGWPFCFDTATRRPPRRRPHSTPTRMQSSVRRPIACVGRPAARWPGAGGSSAPARRRRCAGPA